MSAIVALVAVLTVLLVLLGKVTGIFDEIAKLLSHIRPLYGWGQRRFIRSSIERRAGKLLREMKEEAPFLSSEMEVDWIDPETPREAFLSKGKVVVRLRSEDRYDENFVHATCLFVSTSLLFRAKRYLAPEQRDTLDLYVTAKLLERADDGLVDVFLNDYLLPRTREEFSRVPEYFGAFETLARAGLFYDVLLAELDFLGNKVFGGRLIPELPTEVDQVIDMLETIALRSWRERVELTRLLDYCRIAVVIVGMEEKLQEGIHPWANHIERDLIPRNTESIYLLGMWRNRALLKELAESLSDRYEIAIDRRTTALFTDGLERSVYVTALHRNDPSVFQPRTIERRRRLGPEPENVTVKDLAAAPMLGTVVNFGGQGYGFIELDDRKDQIFFHLKDCIDPPPFVARGDRVECHVRFDGSPQGRARAHAVRFVQFAPTERPREELAAAARGDALAERNGGRGSVGSSNGSDSSEAVVLEPPAGRVSASVLSFGSKEFGFVRLDDGQEAFFHLKDCIDPPISIRAGLEVTCEAFLSPTGQLRVRDVEFALADDQDS
ncbi:MAG: hypothetical protein ACRDPE_14910 [Solirubrobacterales bacterium]